MKQRTIQASFDLSGLGIHSGKEAQVKFLPAPANSGIFFVKNKKKTPALVAQVNKTKRGTTIGKIFVVEHLLAAAYALGIDNLQIEINGDEPPVMDGSALPYAEAMQKAGIVEQKQDKDFIKIAKPIKVLAGEASLKARPYNGFKIDFMVNFPFAGEQHYTIELNPESFVKEIAPARTFGYLEEYELLKEKGLARGASFANALVLGKDGYLNTPRFPDELVRHKILDLIGDLALIGKPIQAEIKAKMSGHKLNIKLARRLLKQ